MKFSHLKKVLAVEYWDDNENLWDHIDPLIDTLWKTMNKVTNPQLSKELRKHYPDDYQKIVDAFHAVNAIDTKEKMRRK